MGRVLDRIKARLQLAGHFLQNTWAGPALLAIAFILVLGVLLGVIQYRTYTEQRSSLVRDTQNARRSLLTRLDGNEDFLALLAETQAEGTLDVATFQERVNPYITDHPEFVSILWADAEFVVRWIAPFEANRNAVGVRLSGSEPRRASQLARDLRQSVYTRPFLTIRGHPAIVFYVPVFRDGQFLGVFGGVYSLEGLLRYGLPPSITDRYHLSLVDQDDTVIVEAASAANIDSRFIRTITLEPDIAGPMLRLARYSSTGWGWELWALTLLTVGLAIGMGGSLWALNRDIQARKETLIALAAREAQYRGVFESTSDGLIINALGGAVVEANPAACEMHGYTYEEFIGLHPTEFIHPDYHHLFEEYVATIRSGDRFQGRAVDVRKDGTEFYVEVRGAPFTYKGEPHILGVVRDVTERVMSEQLLEQRVADRTRKLSALYDVTAVASASLELDTILDRSLDRVLDVMERRAGAIHLLDETGRRLHLAVWRGLPTVERAEIDPLFLDTSLAGLVVGREEPVAVRDIADHSDARLATLLPSPNGCYLGVPMRARGRVVGVLSVLGETGQEPSADEVALLAAIADQVGAAVENAHLYRAETARREEAVRRRRVAEGLRDILAILNSDSELDAVLPQIMEQATNLLDADGAAVVQRNHETRTLHIQAAYGLEEEYVERMEVPYDPNAATDSTERRPIAIHNVDDLMRLVGQLQLPAEWLRRNQDLLEWLTNRFNAMLAVPLTVEDKGYGALILYYVEPQSFTEEEIGLATAFADQVALAIENARLRTESEQLAVLNERSRLARELHDSVTQSLYSMTLFAEAGRRVADTDNWELVHEYLQRVADTARAALREMRLLVYELRPLALQHEGLVGALQHRLDAVERRAGVEVQFIVDDEPEPLPASVEETLYRVAQEALNNALKHAGATNVTVKLHVDTDAVVLAVRDNGLGFSPTAVTNGGGLGLTSMRERIAAMNGTFTIRSEPDHGTDVVVRIPLQTLSETEEVREAL